MLVMNLSLYFTTMLVFLLGGCRSNTESENTSPIIQNIFANPEIVNTLDSTSLICEAIDDERLTYKWSSKKGNFPNVNVGQSIIWQAPESIGIYSITVNVSDGHNKVSDSISIIVIDKASNPIPADGTEVSPDGIELSWKFGNLNTENYLFDVYLGESTNPLLVSENQTEMFYVPQPLTSNKTYYWKINAKGDNNIFTGILWSFRTFDDVFELGNSGKLIEMVCIPAGKFIMGASGTAGAGDDESPSHEVTFTNGYWMGVYEITQSQWEAIKGEKSFSFKGTNKPADNVSWSEAKSFVEKLNESIEGEPWRLPTEAEWEYAARAGNYDTRFWYGNDYSYSETEKHAWINKNSSSSSHDVGTTSGGVPNPWGLWDMGGNMWEWCEDWYHWGYIGAPSDGSAWIDPQGTQRILRGGSWYFEGRRCLPNLRSLYNPSGRTPTFGFRLVKDEKK